MLHKKNHTQAIGLKLPKSFSWSLHEESRNIPPSDPWSNTQQYFIGTHYFINLERVDAELSFLSKEENAMTNPDLGI